MAGAAVWAERYEVLRQFVLEGRQRLPSQPLGLALWVAHGMAGWMRQGARSLELAPAPQTGLMLGQPQGAAQGLTRLLAQITLQHLEGRVGR